MFEKMEIFRMAQGLATYASARQTAIAQNVANADTPGYRARDIAPFAEAYENRGAFTDTAGLRATRAGHIQPSGDSPQWQVREMPRPGDLSPNGNNVSLETELMMSAQVQREHQLALTVYRSALTILRTSIGRG